MVKICFLADADSIHTRKWVDYFSMLGNEVYLISMRDTNYKYKDNVHVHVVKPYSKNKLSYFLIANKISKLVRNIKPDILHSHYATSYGMYGQICNVHPFVISVWGSDVYDFPKKFKIKKYMLKNILKSADVICSTSHDMANETKKYTDKDILITPFGVDIQKFKPLKPILQDEFITIGVVKNLEKIYGIEYLIRAFHQLLQEETIVKSKIIIVGSGSQEDYLKELTRTFKISDRVTFTGAIDNNEVPNYINKMDIVCVPSIMESFGVSAVEACACGRPVIASSVGGLKDLIIDDFNGYTFKSEDVNDLKDKLLKILSNRDKLKVFSKNARELVEQSYNWNDNAKVMQDIYKDLIK